jgi:hypothetical protein
VQRRRRTRVDRLLSSRGATRPRKVVTCTDGDPGCDVDGPIDGVCTFGLTACTNVAVGACRRRRSTRRRRSSEGAAVPKRS